MEELLKFDPGFAMALTDYDLEALNASDQTVYAIDTEFRLRFQNRGWDRFAQANHGEQIVSEWPLGRPIFEGITSELLPFYHDALLEATQHKKVFKHFYKCPTSTLDRTFLMMVYPLPIGWLYVHSEIFAGPHQGEAYTFEPQRYLDQHGFTHQCAHCRKVRRVDGAETWDWIPSLVETPRPQTSHGLCPACLGFYYPVA